MENKLTGIFLVEKSIPAGVQIISKTDVMGTIIYANDAFCDVSGYKREELLGKNHNILRHPDMPKRIFKEMWEIIKLKETWVGIIKNQRKDGGFYWVRAAVKAIYDSKGDLSGYKSIRTPISYEEKKKAQLEYDRIREKSRDNKRIMEYKSIDN